MAHLHLWTTLKRSFGTFTLLASMFLPPGIPITKGELMVYDFDLGPVPAANVDYVRALGYDGLVTRCAFASDIPKLAAYASHVGTITDFDVLAYVSYDFSHPESPQVWLDALPILSSLNAPLWVIVRNAPSSADIDALLLRMAQGAELHGIPLVIYPHWNTDIESAAQADAYMAQLGHSNIYNSFHTCHEIREGNQANLPATLNAHVQDCQIVTLAGAQVGAYSGAPPQAWDDAIMPLDLGTYDLRPFLTALRDSGYEGPVILQTYGLANDPGHLARSIATYAKLLAAI